MGGLAYLLHLIKNEGEGGLKLPSSCERNIHIQPSSTILPLEAQNGYTFVEMIGYKIYIPFG